MAPLPLLLVDPEQIAQALGNLLKNSIEAMPEGGMLKVKTYFTPNGSQQTDLGADGSSSNRHIPKTINGTVSLEIQDTGHGMSEETMANLFVPYYTTKSETDSRGLGMPIVRRIVTEHDAEINFHSTESVGTTVCIHFPYNQGTRSEEFASAVEDLTLHKDLSPERKLKPANT